jgi:phage terminase small subunit
MALTELRLNGADLDRLKSDKQRRFALEYMIDHNPRAAAIRAGYKPNSAAVTAQKLLRNPVIKAFIGKTERLDMERLELDRLMVLKRLVEALNWEVRDLVDPETGLALLPHQLPEHVQKQVDDFDQKITEYEERDGTKVRTVKVRYRMTPRAIAREQAMKHKGLLAPEQSGHSAGAISVRQLLDKLSKPSERVSMKERIRRALEDRRRLEGDAQETPPESR